MYEQTYQKEGSIPQTYLMETYPNVVCVCLAARDIIMASPDCDSVTRLEARREESDD